MVFSNFSLPSFIFGIILLIVGTDFLLKDALDLEISLINLLLETSAIKIITGILLVYFGCRHIKKAFTRRNRTIKKKFEYNKEE